MTYIITFLTAAILGNMAAKYKVLKIPFSFLAIIIPSILGGIRSPRLGTDNFYFFKPDFSIAYYSDSFSEASSKLNFDILSEYTFYVVSRFTSDYHWLCFFFSFTSMTLVYITIYRYRKVCKVWLALLVYFFIFYCPMICYARQSIAVSICFFSIYYAEKKKILYFITLILTATLLHASAIIFAIYYPLYHYLYNNNQLRLNRYILISCILGIAVFSFIFILPDTLLNQTISIERAETLSNRYILADANESTNNVYKLMLSLTPPLILASLHLRKTKNNNLIIYFTFVFYAILITAISFISIKAYRISFYYSLFLILLLANKSLTCKKNNHFYTFLSICYLIAYWYLFTVRNGYGFSLPVYPYITDVF